MQLTLNKIERTCPESDIYNQYLNLDNKNILELGCGNAAITRIIATEGQHRQITAFEVDEIQHIKNSQIQDLPNVSFKFAGAENIPEPDNKFDIVMMFKSLHHVPENLMKQSMHEIHRVLKPSGMLYISEPIFKGDFNEVLRLFHDEQHVRLTAFQNVKDAVESNLFSLSEQIFFNTNSYFKDFIEFEETVIKTTHSDHSLNSELHQLVKNCFMKNIKDDGAYFTIPIRVDLLQKNNRTQNIQ